MKKVFILALITAAIGIIGVKLLQPKLAPLMFEKAVKANFGASPNGNKVDALTVYICGAGSPLPDPKRSGPCIGVQAGDQYFIFDTGSGGVRNLGPMGFPAGRAEQIFLTHLHSDHIDGLGEAIMLNWVGSGRSAPVPVSGPVGTVGVVDGFNQAYQLDSQYRTTHHGPMIANPVGYGGIGQEIDHQSDSQTVLENSDLKITAFRVNHAPVAPAFGYRVDYKDRSIAISGDTAYEPNIAIASKNVDVLFHEALNKDMVQMMSDAASNNGAKNLAKIASDILDYHASPVEAAQTAKNANAKALVLYHIVPPLPRDALIPMFVKGTAEAFDGEITVSQDGLIIRLPSGTNKIEYENKF